MGSHAAEILQKPLNGTRMDSRVANIRFAYNLDCRATVPRSHLRAFARNLELFLVPFSGPWSLQSVAGGFALSDRSISGSLGVAAVIARGNKVARMTEANFIMKVRLWALCGCEDFGLCVKQELCRLVVVECGLYILQNCKGQVGIVSRLQDHSDFIMGR